VNAAPPVTPLIEVRGLVAELHTRQGVVRAIDGIDLEIAPGETLGLVGESGSGKTMTALALERMLPPSGRIVSGEIRLEGTDLLALDENAMRRVRGSRIAMILQDPMSSLNPVFTVCDQIAAPMHAHRDLDEKDVLEEVRRLLERVRIPSPESRMRDYPHQLSGGMRQRVVGAIALSCQPGLLIADEPTTALDTTIQAQYLKLLEDLQREVGFAILLITHDLGVVAKLCDRVAVMYAGRIVETAPVDEIFDHPAHPYTRALLDSLPRMDVRVERLPSIEGQPPDLRLPMTGCRFAPRCAHASEQCRNEYPPQTTLSPSHRVSCWLATEHTKP